jgi:hypothetical protein
LTIEFLKVRPGTQIHPADVTRIASRIEFNAKAEPIESRTTTVRCPLQHKLGHVRPKLIGVYVKNAELIDTVGRVIEILRIRALKVAIEAQPQNFRQQPPHCHLLRFSGNRLELMNNRTRFFFSPGICAEKRSNRENQSNKG